MPHLEGAVFDVDGTLFDTERLTRRMWEEVSAQAGRPQVGKRYLDYAGRNRIGIIRLLREHWGENFPAEEFLMACSRRSQEWMELHGVPVKPGAEDILRFLHSRGLPLALATSTGRERTLRRLEMTGLGQYFQVVITGDMITNGKPDPEIYLLACSRLGVLPAAALAVEDSRSGILSASAAGMTVAMVPDLFPPAPDLKARIWDEFPSLTALRERLESEFS